MTRQNILLIQSDQHRYDCVGANGHPLLKTPNMDRLADEGMNFSQAYTPIPLCVPVRNCLLHGQWSTEHLCIANYDAEAPRAPEPGLPTFSRALRDGGYYLGYVGKWHVSRDRDPTHPMYGFHDYVNDWSYHRWREEQGLPPRPREQGWLGELDPFIEPEASRLAWGADHTIRLMERALEEDVPFFVRWDPVEPHLPNVVPEPYFSMYPPDEIAPWPSYPDPLMDKPYIQAQQLRTWGLTDWTWEDWSKVVSRYLGEISLLDAQLGRLLDALDELGIAEDTLVIYTTDHGDMCGGHGMIDKHFVMYDDVVRVPMMVRWPGQVVPGGVCDAFVAHSIDLASTFCDVAGVPAPDTFRGQSLVPIFEGAGDTGREDIFSMYHGNQFGLYSQRMVRDRRWKYVWNATAEDELYDLVEDPGELCNLAIDPSHEDELSRLRRRLVDWMEATDDTLLNTWTRTQLLQGRSR